MVVTFDTWGNRFAGLHGYDTIGISVGTKRLQIYDMQQGGFHDDDPYYGSFTSAQDKKMNPEEYRFPVNTFR